jgi:S1-C subfamily serine protease
MGAVVIVAILFGVLAGFGGTILAFWAQQKGLVTFLPERMAALANDRAHINIPINGPNASLPSFAAVADRINESVVNVNTRKEQANPYSLFFGGGPEVVSGIGTGIIVSSDGYIITNFHVAGDADKITVTVMHKSGKKEYPAKLIGGDKQEDLALIKIEAKGLQPVTLGDSNTVQPGEWVMAMGNPFGFEHTVSVGVVSALNRQLPVDDAVTMKGMIQTDASINPGNSGGPLINSSGEVIGINTAVYTGRSGGAQASGIGFSIPSNRVKEVEEQLRKTGKVKHPYLGISYRLITDELRTAQHLPPTDGGVEVMHVIPKGPADKAGLQKGDIIISAGGQPLKESGSLGDIVGKTAVGGTLDLQIKRFDGARGVWNDSHVAVRVEDAPKKLGQDPQRGLQQAPPSEGGEGGGIIPFPFPFGR